MSFQWIEMRIGEESDRRKREAEVLAKLPRATDELQAALQECVTAYTAVFGPDSAGLTRQQASLKVTAGAESAQISEIPELPGFRVQRPEGPLDVQVGMLPGDKLFYFDVAADQYLSMEELTRKILDRVLFPKLRE